ncbi:MAG: prephenate dehydratase [Actinobacteria bacterium]|nr:prephenate dehydratase [Actinomycetota bacterium]
MKVAFLGPPGTFSEEALLSDSELGAVEPVPMHTIADVLDSTQRGEVDLGFVPIENSIEGMVNATQDSLIFDFNLLIQREVVFDVHLNLLVRPRTSMREIRRVLTFPVAAAQCRGYLARVLPGVEVSAANSTADAARQLGRSKMSGTAAIAPALSARLYGLEVLEAAIEDHPGNQTRFVAVAPSGVPAPTGHDRTSIVCFQRRDRPGSLHSILGQFAARSINLTRLESRPTKRGLGDYCFVIDMEGHLEDEVVADCLRDLHAELASIKFLGSYPVGGKAGQLRRRLATAAWKRADQWIASLKEQVMVPGRSG